MMFEIEFAILDELMGGIKIHPDVKDGRAYGKSCCAYHQAAMAIWWGEHHQWTLNYGCKPEHTYQDMTFAQLVKRVSHNRWRKSMGLLPIDKRKKKL